MLDVKTLKYLAENASASILTEVISSSGLDLKEISPQEQFEVLESATKNHDYAVWDILKKHGFDLDMYNPATTTAIPEKEYIRGETIINEIIDSSNDKLLDYLLSKKLVNIQSHGNSYILGYSPGNIKETLEKHNVKNRAGFSEINTILSKAHANGEREINIAELLEKGGYYPNLDHAIIDPSLITKDKFDKVDFSNVSCRHMGLVSIDDIINFRTSSHDLAELKFQNCDMTKANLYSAGVISYDGCFDGSNIEGMIATTTPKAVETSANIGKAEILFIDPDRIFKQGKFIDAMNSAGANLNTKGICNGLVTEYGRYHLKERTEEEKPSHENIISKFNSKTAQDTNFLERLNTYQDQLQPRSKDYREFKNTILGKVVKAADKYLPSSKIIGVDLIGKYSAHTLCFRVSKSDSNKPYRLFEPNFGESPPLMKEELEFQIKALYHKYRYEGNIQIYDLEAKIKELDLINTHDKDAKYLKGHEYLFAAIENNDVVKIAELTSSGKGLPAHMYSTQVLQAIFKKAKSEEALIAFLDNCKHIHWASNGCMFFETLPYKYQSEKMIDLFLKKGADLTNALHDALSRDYVDWTMGVNLVKAGVNFVKEDGEKLLASFGTYNNPLTPELVKTLVDHNVDLNVSLPGNLGKQVTILDKMLEYAPPLPIEQVGTLKALVEHGANVSHIDKTKLLLDALMKEGYIPPLAPQKIPSSDQAISASPIHQAPLPDSTQKISYTERLEQERKEFKAKPLGDRLGYGQ